MTPGRFELLRALGAIADNPADARAACRALGVPELDSHEHTEFFVLNCPPYASVYLGPDGALGGEGADRVAGFWRVIGISPPAEPDHLSSLLSLYASLGQAAADSTRPATAGALGRAQAALFVGAPVALAARLPRRRDRSRRAADNRLGRPHAKRRQR